MRKGFKLLCFSALSASLLLTGCTKKEETSTTTPEPTATPETTATPEAVASEAPATTLGGWSVYPDNEAHLTDEQKALFEKTFEGWTGVGYEPLDVVATQVVSGTNYAYLAKGTTVTANPEIGYYIVTIYEDLSGNSEMLCIKGLDFTKPVVTEDAPENLAGGWSITDNEKAGTFTDSKVQDSFTAALGQYVGVNLIPVSLLGTQLVSGTNYCALCRGATVTPDAVRNLYLVTWYEDLQGNSKITDVQRLDINYYVDPSVQ